MGMRGIGIAAAVAALLLLQACGGEPSEADMRSALEQRTAARRDNPLGALLAVEFDAFEKVGCTRVPDGDAYDCRYRYRIRKGDTLAGAVAGGTWDEGQARFAPTKGGWVVLSR